jgi:DNA-binding transcriptional ArsR family regulator
MSRQLPQPQLDELDVVSVLHALSDPIRLEIVRALAHSGDGRPCGSFDVPVTKSTLTHHFRVLRESGVLAQRHDGTTKLCTLRAADLGTRFPGLLDAVLSAEPERMPEPVAQPVAS